MRRLGTALLSLVTVLLVALAAPGARGHDIVADVKIGAFFRPAGDRLELLLRVPLAAMADVDVPTRGPGYLDLARAEPALHDATKLWLTDNIDVYENDLRLAPPRVAELRVSLASDRSFASYEAALVHLRGPRLADDIDLYWNQQLLDVLLEYKIGSDRSDFAIAMRVDRLGARVTTALRFLPPGGAERAFQFHGDPGLLRLDPRWHQAALRFAVDGFFHILDGIDHLLFLLCLVLPVRRAAPLVAIVTSFTIAHSITLIASAFGFVPDALWFPPLVETLIAATIVYMALENIVGASLPRRWLVTFAFGLIHGFGFSFALRETLQFAGDHLVASLLAFNVGVEIGQLAVLAVALPLLRLLFARVVAERMGTIILSAFVAHTAWHWLLERGEQLLQFPFPRLDAAFLASLMRGAMAALVLAGLVWLASGWVNRWVRAHAEAPAREPAE